MTGVQSYLADERREPRLVRLLLDLDPVLVEQARRQVDDEHLHGPGRNGDRPAVDHGVRVLEVLRVGFGAVVKAEGDVGRTRPQRSDAQGALGRVLLDGRVVRQGRDPEPDLAVEEHTAWANLA